MKKGRPERNYIAITEGESFILPLYEMAQKFNCDKSLIIMAVLKGHKRKLNGKVWYIDYAL